jgi:putative MFS transporter
MARPPFSPYQRRLFAFLSVATLFEGYDFFALAQVLPQIQQEYELTDFGVTALSAFVNAGTVAAMFLLRLADRWGRKRVLQVTIAGYTLATLVSGLAPNLATFAIAQCIGRVFLTAEWATTTVVAAEEFPADRRGEAMGLLQAFSSLGAILCVGVVPLLLRSPLGWRTVYLLGVVPLLLLAYARRGLKETARFEAVGPRAPSSLFATISGPHRRRIVQLGIAWLLTYSCTQNAIHFWKLYAVSERGWTDAQVGSILTAAALLAMPLVFLSGHLIDRIGRRKGAAVIYACLVGGTWFAYALPRGPLLVTTLTIAVFAVTAVLTVLKAYTAELFPTDVRADAFAWSNAIIGRVGYVLSPLLIGALAETRGWAGAIQPTMLLPALAYVLIVIRLPETASKELEDIA